MYAHRHLKQNKIYFLICILKEMQKSVLDTGLSTKDETIDFNDDLSGPYSGICPGGLNIFSLEGGLKPTEIHRFL